MLRVRCKSKGDQVYMYMPHSTGLEICYRNFLAWSCKMQRSKSVSQVSQECNDVELNLRSAQRGIPEQPDFASPPTCPDDLGDLAHQAPPQQPLDPITQSLRTFLSLLP